MNLINYYLSKLLSWIDNGAFFIRPMKWCYNIFAVLSFIPPILLLLYYYKLADEGMFQYMEGWTRFSAYFFCFVFFIFVLFASLLMFYFWIHRRKKIDQAVRVGDQVVVFPLTAHFWQSFGESWGIYLGIVPSVGGILFFIWGLVTGFDFFSHYDSHFFRDFLIALVVLILFICLNIIIGFVIITFWHFISESIKMRAQVANDVRDLGDIHRAATFATPVSSVEEVESDNENE